MKPNAKKSGCMRIGKKRFNSKVTCSDITIDQYLGVKKRHNYLGIVLAAG